MESFDWVTLLCIGLSFVCPVFAASGITIAAKYKRVIDTAACVLSATATPNDEILNALVEANEKALASRLTELVNVQVSPQKEQKQLTQLTERSNLIKAKFK